MVRHGIDLDSTAVREFCRKWRVKELTAFGSIVSNDFGPDSDIDFIIEWEDDAPWDICDYMNMVEELQQHFGRNVDLLSRNALSHTSNYLLRRPVLNRTESAYAL